MLAPAAAPRAAAADGDRRAAPGHIVIRHDQRLPPPGSKVPSASAAPFTHARGGGHGAMDARSGHHRRQLQVPKLWSRFCLSLVEAL